MPRPPRRAQGRVLHIEDSNEEGSSPPRRQVDNETPEESDEAGGSGRVDENESLLSADDADAADAADAADNADAADDAYNTDDADAADDADVTNADPNSDQNIKNLVDYLDTLSKHAIEGPVGCQGQHKITQNLLRCQLYNGWDSDDPCAIAFERGIVPLLTNERLTIYNIHNVLENAHHDSKPLDGPTSVSDQQRVPPVYRMDTYKRGAWSMGTMDTVISVAKACFSQFATDSVTDWDEEADYWTEWEREQEEAKERCTAIICRAFMESDSQVCYMDPFITLQF
ncbi:hypothetical protein SLS60_003415 [Paraconiothyrium brasiliense]|uniref:Uncharacterized protein n=1 Tax=Paraconiothyrium brasiliense TaxID=300254 RepID=A0ABR3RW43_9PLEO